MSYSEVIETYRGFDIEVHHDQDARNPWGRLGRKLTISR